MDSSYRPQSPDLSSYAPRSPDLSGFQPQSLDLTAPLPSPRYGHQHSHSRDRFGNVFLEHNNFAASPTSVPLQAQYSQQPQYDQQPHYDMPPPRYKEEEGQNDDDYLPDAEPTKTSRRSKRNQRINEGNGSQFGGQLHTQLTGPLQGMKTEPGDPTLGVQLKTSFPVARIKRIMQADDDIGKVAQVTPHVVSRALELFMIRLISSSAAQAAQSGGGGTKGPKRILAQHVKRALVADDSYDFLADVIAKVPDAPTKAKKEAGSDSEEGAGAVASNTGGKPAKKRGRKRKESGDDV
ncbi:hypothetical protein LTR37_017865 [Vermiconidia calcicola]|uniref:Uncharacterized protein n=1 Tax=Vermiconidia calcicola TaxID=1690605 RepID=A0ACC3MKA4_9PEZI|nr:hypothetical protein LTR37_017865 [Vermiconidia calcicola]